MDKNPEPSEDLQSPEVCLGQIYLENEFYEGLTHPSVLDVARIQCQASHKSIKCTSLKCSTALHQTLKLGAEL